MATAELKLPADSYGPAARKYLSAHAKGFEDIRIAVAGLEALGKPVKDPDDWLRRVAATRNADGTFGQGPGAARATGSAVVVILRMGGAVEHRETVLKALRAGQRADGGFGTADAPASDLETTYRVLRAFVMLRERPADPARLAGFIAKCRNADGGYGLAPGHPSQVGATYYAAIMLHWLSTI
jgi:prenyltransferase beta subunit